jgi:hypothetical protein
MDWLTAWIQLMAALVTGMQTGARMRTQLRATWTQE